MRFSKLMLLCIASSCIPNRLCAQFRVTSGTSLHVLSGTTLIVDIPGQKMFIDSLSAVTNDGVIQLGDSTNLDEKLLYPISGSGTEITLRMLNSPALCNNIGGLGISFIAPSISGITAVKRGHQPIVNNSVKRWFAVLPVNTPISFGTTVELAFDPTELNSNPLSLIGALHTTDTSVAWDQLAGVTNPATYICTTTTDSIGWFSLSAQDIKLTNLNDTAFCHGDSLHVSFLAFGYYEPGNQFIFELSDQNGSYAAPSISSSLSAPSGTFSEYIPAIPQGTSYTLHVRSTAPVHVTTDTLVSIYSSPPIPTIIHSGDSLYSSVLTGCQWYLDSVPIPGANSYFYVPSANGNYSVTISNGLCSSMSTDYYFNYSDVSSSTALPYLIVYPNPANDYLYVTLPVTSASIHSICLVSSDGKQVLLPTPQKQSTYAPFRIEVPDVANGIYCLIIKDDRFTYYSKFSVLK